MRFRPRQLGDETFLLEMARYACTLEGRPLPAQTDREVVATSAQSNDLVVVASDDTGQAIGAAWCGVRAEPLLANVNGQALPELAVAVKEGHRDQGVGSALIEVLAAEAAASFQELSLNVHVSSPTVRLYERLGFVSAGTGRGPLGLAMRRPLATDLGLRHASGASNARSAPRVT
jgi:predicted N-acetyltransferase YhbS